MFWEEKKILGQKNKFFFLSKTIFFTINKKLFFSQKLHDIPHFLTDLWGGAGKKTFPFFTAQNIDCMVKKFIGLKTFKMI